MADDMSDQKQKPDETITTDAIDTTGADYLVIGTCTCARVLDPETQVWTFTLDPACLLHGTVPTIKPDGKGWYCKWLA